MRNRATGNVSTGRQHQILKFLPVFSCPDGIDVCPNELNTVLFKRTTFVKSHRCIQGCLSTESWQDRVGLLLFDYRLDYLGGNWLDIGRICKVWIGHDCCWVGVDQNDPDAFFLQDPAGLGTGVVKLTRLAYHNRSRPDHQNRVDVRTFGH